VLHTKGRLTLGRRRNIRKWLQQQQFGGK